MMLSHMRNIKSFDEHFVVFAQKGYHTHYGTNARDFCERVDVREDSLPNSLGLHLGINGDRWLRDTDS